MIDPREIQSNTPPKYRHKLISNRGVTILTKPPLEWKSGEIEFNRDVVGGGVYPEFNVSSLTFLANGATLLNELFEEKWTNAKCEYKSEVFNPLTMDYIPFPTTYEIIFRKWQTSKVGRFVIGVTVPVRKSGIHSKLEARRSSVVDITKNITINGTELVDYVDLKSIVQLPEISVSTNASTVVGRQTMINNVEVTLDLIQIIKNEFNEFRLVDGGLSSTKENSFFFESSETRSLNLLGIITMEVLSNKDCFAGIAIARFDINGLLIDNTVIGSVEIDKGTEIAFLSWNYDYTVNQGESLCCNVIGISQPGVTEIVKWISGTFQVSQSEISTPIHYASCRPLYESTERVLQLTLDMQYPLYAPALARLNVPYNENGDTYQVESQLTNAVLVTGLSLRGQPLNRTENPLPLSVDVILKTLLSLHNLGYGIEEFEGSERIVIDHYRNFYLDETLFDFRDRLSKYDIERMIDEKLCFINVFSGFENFTYEVKNGRGEYNVKSSRTTVLNAEQNFNNLSPIRGDVRGITKAIENFYNVDISNDEKSDNDVFIIKTQYSDEIGIPFKAETNENIIVENNSSLYGSGSLNLYYTPTRSLNRRSEYWASCLQKDLDKKVRFQMAEKSQELKTTGTAQSGESYTITENEDLDLNAAYIDPPIFDPIILDFEVEFSWDNYITLMSDPKNKYKKWIITDNWEAWILRFNKKNTQDLAKCKLLLKHKV